GYLATGGELSGPDVHTGAGEITRKIRREVLGGRYGLQEAGRKEIQRNHLALRLGAGKPSAVQRGSRVALREPANGNVLTVLHAHAAHSLYRGRGVAIRASRNLLRRD